MYIHAPLLKAGDSPPWVWVRGQRVGWETSGPTGVYEPGWKPPWSGRASERAPVWGAAWGSGQSPRHSEPQVGTGGTGTQVLGDNGVERKSSSSSLLRRGRPQHPAALSLRRSPSTDPFPSESLSLSLSLKRNQKKTPFLHKPTSIKHFVILLCLLKR